MKNVSEVFDEVVNTCINAQDRSRASVFGMAVEEVGEISTAIFRPEKVDESAFSESCDLVIAAVDNCFMNFIHERYSIEDTRAMAEWTESDIELLRSEFHNILAVSMDKKLGKWKSMIEKQRAR